MIRVALLVVLLGLSASSCSNEEFTPIPREDMLSILSDIHLAEVYSTMVRDSLNQSVNKNMDSLSSYYKTILAHHNISYADLKKNMDWYSTHPADLDTVYINMLDEMSAMEGVLNPK